MKQSSDDRPSLHDTTPEPITSQSMDDATISLEVMTTNIPSSLPAGDEEFNLHLSNATTECSIVSTGIATQDEVLEVSYSLTLCKIMKLHQSGTCHQNFTETAILCNKHHLYGTILAI